jgi:alkaline phosphatase
MARDRFVFLKHATITLLVVVAVFAAISRFARFELEFGGLVIRTQRGTTHPFPVPTAVADPPVPFAAVTDGRPRNVILMIGDGMGLGQVSSASALIHGPAGGLAIERFPVAGLVRTSAADNLAADSAASASAMATGLKCSTKAISTLDDGSRPVTLFEVARGRGLATGVVTTSGLVDATPAAFTAHAARRTHYSTILRGMLDSGADVLIGGDWRFYRKARRDTEFQELIGRIDELGAEAGYTVVRDARELAAAEGPVLGLFPPRGRASDAHGPPLQATVLNALDRLADEPGGFLAVFESEVTDGAGHANDIGLVIDGVRELDDAVSAVLAWAEQRGDTLVLVTADHDTGGLGVIEGRYRDGDATVRWATDVHTAQWVPLFAAGPGAHLFGRVLDNTEIGRTVADLLDLAPFPSVGNTAGAVD